MVHFVFAFLQINLRCLDGIQGPVYVGSACIFRRKSLTGCDSPISSKRPSMVQVHSKQDENGEEASITGDHTLLYLSKTHKRIIFLSPISETTLLLQQQQMRKRSY